MTSDDCECMCNIRHRRMPYHCSTSVVPPLPLPHTAWHLGKGCTTVWGLFLLTGVHILFVFTIPETAPHLSIGCVGYCNGQDATVFWRKDHHFIKPQTLKGYSRLIKWWYTASICHRSGNPADPESHGAAALCPLVSFPLTDRKLQPTPWRGCSARPCDCFIVQISGVPDIRPSLCKTGIPL